MLVIVSFNIITNRARRYLRLSLPTSTGSSMGEPSRRVPSCELDLLAKPREPPFEFANIPRVVEERHWVGLQLVFLANKSPS